MIHASLALFACLCVGTACWKLSHLYWREIDYGRGALDERTHCRARTIAVAQRAFKSGQATGIKIATDRLSNSTK